MEKITEYLIEVIKQASNLITPEFEIKSKNDKGDLVTNFDFEIEEFMIAKLKGKYPEFDIVSEEFNSNNEVTDNCFVIDPIDGTVNFAHGLPLWGIQVACIKDKKPCSSVIYLPKLNELYYADKTGAFLNGEQIFVKQWEFRPAMFVLDGGNKVLSFSRLVAKTRNVRALGAHCVNLAWVACGKLSGAIFKRDSFWDYIPGQYLVEQAGGVVYDEVGMHIAASNLEYVNFLKEECKEANEWFLHFRKLMTLNFLLFKVFFIVLKIIKNRKNKKYCFWFYNIKK